MIGKAIAKVGSPNGSELPKVPGFENAMKFRPSLALLLLFGCLCSGQTNTPGIGSAKAQTAEEKTGKTQTGKEKPGKAKPASSARFLALPIGDAFTLPECEKRPDPPMMYAPGLDHWCWQDASGTPKTGTPQPTPQKATVQIHIPPAEAPAYIVNNELFAKIENGKLQTVTFHANGVRAVDDVLEALTSMYGKPTHQEPVKVENNVGVEFQSQNAFWQFTDLSVAYHGVDGDLSVGTVWIETPSAYKARIEMEKKTPGNPLK